MAVTCLLSLGACSTGGSSSGPVPSTPWSALPAVTTTVAPGTAPPPPAPDGPGIPATCSTAAVIAHAPVRLKVAQVLTVEQPGAAPVYALTLHAAPPLAPRLLAGVHVEPDTPEGAAALAVLGVTP